MRYLISVSCLLLAACADFPELDVVNSETAGTAYLDLVPFENYDAPDGADGQTEAELAEARAAALRAKATRIRNTTP